MAELLVDTDVFVDHLRGHSRLQPARDTIAYSVITRCELFAGPVEQEGAVRNLLAAFRELDVDGATAELAGRLRRTTGIRTPDALIAATALAADLALVTRNIRDFESVPDLILRAP